MSTDSPPPKKLPLHRRFLPTTIAGKAAATAALLLTAILVMVWMLRLFGSDSVRLSHAVSVTHMIIELALVVMIPVVLYWGIRRWNQVIEGEYPEIDRAWEAGIEALRAKGVALTDYPIFLILGSSDDEVEHGLMEALDTKMIIHGVPDATGVSHALQWYMSSDAIYLFCPGASSLSALMGRWTAPTLKSGPRQNLAARLSTASATTPSASAVGSSDANSSQIGIPKIQRVERSATGSASKPSGPQTVGPESAKSQPAMLKKESSMRPAAHRENVTSSAPEPYLGTIQHHSIDSAPRESSIRDTAAAATGRGTPFDMPSARPKPQPFSAPASDTSGDALRPAPRYQGTISFDQYASAPQPSSASQRGPSDPPTNAASTREFGPPRSTGTVSVDHGVAATGTVDATTPKSKGGSTTATKPVGSIAMPRGSAGKKIALPASLDTSDQLPRLRYVCKLLKRSRRPMCGINGAITLLPFELSRVGPLQLSAIAQSARGDVAMIQDTLGIRSPVTAVLVGLEQDKGFAELVRRLQSGLLSRRLGGRFDLRSRPTPEELNTHSDRLCDAFEDWVYRLFSREDGLAQQRGNRKLYALTCKIRHELKPRLRIVLGQAFGCESSESGGDATDDDSFFFSGCYFAASGAMSGQPAFVKGVLQDKLADEQSKVQWTKQTLRTHRLFTIFSIIGWILCILLIAALIAKQVM
ncbi:MAG: hypothetical protein KDB00_00830 [Planctomycetales bacterium]|nr:hypothetical protein [Planctomycetales bacterium]